VLFSSIGDTLTTNWMIAGPILELQMYQNMFQKGVSRGYNLIKLS